MPEKQLQPEYGIHRNNPEKFANWSIGKNLEFLNRYFDFCEILPGGWNAAAALSG